jgi:hypothetical protein
MKNDVKKVVYGIPLPLMDKSYFPCRSPGSSQIVSYVENVALDGSNRNDLDVDSLNYYWHRIGGLYHICY